MKVRLPPPPPAFAKASAGKPAGAGAKKAVRRSLGEGRALASQLEHLRRLSDEALAKAALASQLEHSRRLSDEALAKAGSGKPAGALKKAVRRSLGEGGSGKPAGALKKAVRRSLGEGGLWQASWSTQEGCPTKPWRRRALETSQLEHLRRPSDEALAKAVVALQARWST